MDINIFDHTEALVGIGMAACGWVLATVRKKENRIRSVEDKVGDLDRRMLEVREDVKEIKSTVNMLLEHQLKK